MSGPRVTAGGAGGELRALARRTRSTIAEARQRADVVQAWGLLRERDSDGRLGAALPYTEAGIQAFEALQAASPGDPSVLHHLAIAHHARAWDLERGGDTGAKQAWLRSLTCWNALIGADAWWDLLKAKLAVSHPQADPELVTTVRRELKDELVDVHRDFILWHWRAAPARSQAHQDIVHRALPDKRARLEERLLEVVVKDAATAAAAAEYATALTTLEHFLNLYPDNLRALGEHARTSAQWFEALRAEGGYDKAFKLDRRAKAHGLRLVRRLRRSGPKGAAAAMNADIETLAMNIAIWAIHRTEDLFADQPVRQAADNDVKALEIAVWWCRLAWRSTVAGADLRLGFVKCAVHYCAALHDRTVADMAVMSNSLMRRLMQRCAKYLAQALRARPGHQICQSQLNQVRAQLALMRD